MEGRRKRTERIILVIRYCVSSAFRVVIFAENPFEPVRELIC